MTCGPTFSIATSQLLPQLPTLLIEVVAVILGFIYLKHHAKSAILLITGGTLMLLTSVGSSFAMAGVIAGQAGSAPAEAFATQMMIVGIISGLSYAVALALFVAAAVVGRRQQPHAAY